ncbi:MAG: hypothetical protein HY710_08175 [Candidatus Latescibacteria bacterium]|nr:hypothetical protein [Candidatus Latescibacterota bacterium]
MRIRLVKAFESPGPHPNGLQATTDGLWIIDQGTNQASCVRFEDGVVRGVLDTGADRPSGITNSGTHLWIASTYSREILQCDPQTGATLAAYSTPGTTTTGAHGLEWVDGLLWMAVPPAATIYQIDPADWTIRHAIPAPGTRPHGLAWENGRLWCVETNHRAVYLLDPSTGAILDRIGIDGPEPHGFTVWQGTFWVGDADTRAIYRGERER